MGGRRKGGKKQNAALSTPQSNPSSASATPSVNSTAMDQTVSAVSALQISNSASSASTQPASGSAPATNNSAPIATTASAAGASTAPQAGAPIRASTDPKQESLQAVPQIGEMRPPEVEAQPNNQKVLTNYFKVTLETKKRGAPVLHEYQLSGLLVAPPNDLSRPKKKVMIKRFIQMTPILAAANAPFVYNGEGRFIAWRNLDPSKAIGQTVVQQLVPDYNRNQQGVVSQYLTMDLGYVRTIDLSDLQNYAQGQNMAYPASVAEEALNILLGQAVTDSNTGAIQIGDNHYFSPNQPFELGSWGLIGLRGYTSHIKARRGGLFLNVNTAFSAFYKGNPVSQHIQDLSPSPGAFIGNQRGRQHLIGLRVRIRYNRDKPGEVGSTKDTPEGRLKSITGISTKPANEIFFTDRFNATVSVWQHFETNHPAEAAQSASKGRQFCVNTSGTQPGQECWFLSDQLDVVQGQMYRKTLDRLSPTLTAAMINFATQRPDVNQGNIESVGMAALGFQPQHPDPARLIDAGVLVAKRMTPVPVRLIPSPTISYGSNQQLTLKTPGQWSTRNMKFLSQDRSHFNGTDGVAFYCPTQNLGRPQLGGAYIQGFERAWQLNYNQRQNIRLGNRFQPFPAPGLNSLPSVTQTMRANKAGLVVLALPSANAQIRPMYANFRIVMDQIIGKPSLVFCEDRAFGSVKAGSPITGGALLPYFANNASKLNTRLGNMNHSASGYQALSPGGVCNTLVLGADLIHPKATSAEVCPTIACIAASIDGIFAKFLGSARRQDPRVEIIDSTNMVSMVTEALKNWQSRNAGRLPARILYYRDGTGDSQYAGILSEISAIKTAHQNVAGPQGSTKVVVTAVVAVKRHTTRFYPVKGGQSTRTGNIIPGSVINRDITSPYHFDFYLQSHDVERGSAKATLYRVLENGMRFSEVEIQNLTNAFCYNFSHSASAVSYASPAYYADRLCERCMLYLREFFDNDPSVQGLANNAARTTLLDTAWGRGGQGVGRNPWNANFNDKMFWM